jgi:hypothetical protein
MSRQVKKTGLRFFTMLGLLAVILVFSCFSEPSNNNNQGKWYSDFASPYECMCNLIYCFGNYQTEPNIIDKYKEVLDSTYVFYFDPDDIGDKVGDYTIPSLWTYDEDWRATNNMFNQAYSIEFKIPILDQGESAFGKPGDTDTTYAKNNVTISFTLMVDPTSGYIAQGICDFSFVKNDNGQWHLSVWKDHTAQ